MTQICGPRISRSSLLSGVLAMSTASSRLPYLRLVHRGTPWHSSGLLANTCIETDIPSTAIMCKFSSSTLVYEVGTIN